MTQYPEGPHTLPFWNHTPKNHPNNYFGAGGPNYIIVVRVWTLLGKSLSLRSNCDYTTAKHLVVATRLPAYSYLNPDLKPQDDPAIANDVKSFWQVSPTSKPQKRVDVGSRA